MARTRGVSGNFSDGGELLGKGGEPIPVNPIRGVSALNPHGAPQKAIQGEVIAPEPVAAPEYAYVCDKTTWQRNMDGWQALHLLNVMLKDMIGDDLSATLGYEAFSRLPSDIRWHFKRKVVTPMDPVE